MKQQQEELEAQQRATEQELKEQQQQFKQRLNQKMDPKKLQKGGAKWDPKRNPKNGPWIFANWRQINQICTVFGGLGGPGPEKCSKQQENACPSKSPSGRSGARS